jgi:aminoglycoside phosphotransferase (APT) family kinase protein
MEALKDTDVPVAKMHWLEEDPSILGAPFFLMERLDGEVPQDYPPYHGSGMFFDASPAERTRMWWGGLEGMINVHKLDWKGLGLSFLGVPEGGSDPVDRQLAYWKRYFEWFKDVPEEAHPTLEASMAWLDEHRYVPERVTLCWGDSRIGNVLYDPGDRRVLAVMDWEMAFLGDPEADLSWFLLLDWQHSAGAGLARCEGTPEHEDTIRRYEDLTGWKVKNLLFNEVLSAVRYGMILACVLKNFKRQGIPIDEDMILNNVCTQRLSELLDLPSPGEKREQTADLNQVIVSVQLHFTGVEGYDWHLISDKGRGERHPGVLENPTCSITVSLDDWKKIQSGELNRLEAWSSGRLVTEGDLNVMMQLEDMISEFTD